MTCVWGEATDNVWPHFQQGLLYAHIHLYSLIAVSVHTTGSSFMAFWAEPERIHSTDLEEIYVSGEKK